MPIELLVEPAYIPLTSEKFGKLELMEHQLETKDSDEHLLILDAPTSSGKTLAMLTKFVEKKKHAVFVYPTNELIKDQGKGISELLERIGRSSIVIPIEQGPELNNLEDYEVIIAVLSGESLEGIARKGEVIKKVLDLAEEKQLLLLTNMDTLFLMFKMKYFKGRTLISEFLNMDYSVLAIDELHLYSGVAFANLLYLIWLLKDIFEHVIVSSATLHNSVGVLQELFESHKVISPRTLNKSTTNCLQIRHEVKVEIKPCEGILSKKDLLTVRNEIDNSLFKSDIEGVNTLVITNSVVFAEELADMLERDYGRDIVGRINGFVPAEYREQKPVTIGTSAIEVGVDFDVSNLIFEGTNAGSFIQRFGRVGRHREGKAVAYIPESAYREMNKLFKEAELRIFIKSLTKIVSKSIPHLETYAEFSKSSYGAMLFMALLYEIEKETLKRYNPDEMYRSLKRDFEELKPPFFREFTFEDILRKSPFNILNLIAKGGARGDILSIPVFLSKYNCYSRMDILEVLRTNFYFKKVSDISCPAPPWVRDVDRVPVIEKIGEKKWLRGTWKDELWNTKTKKILYTRATGKRPNFSPNLENEELERMVEELLDKKIVYPTINLMLTDWRFPRIYHSKYGSQCLVLGLDALVQKYVEESNV